MQNWLRFWLWFDLAMFCWDVWFCIEAAAHSDIARAMFYYGFAALMLAFAFADQRAHINRGEPNGETQV